MSAISNQLDRTSQLKAEAKVARAPYIRHIQSGDIEALDAHLRLADRKELMAHGFASVKHGLVESLRGSDYVQIIADSVTGDVYGIYGIRVWRSNYGVPWMLGTEAIRYFPQKFIKEARKAIASWKDVGLKKLKNTVHEKNELHIKWLRYMGFTFLRERHKIPSTGEYFIPFEMEF